MMGKKKLVIAMGSEVENFINEMKGRSIPFMRMKYAPIYDRARKKWNLEDFAEKVSNIICPGNKGEVAYVIVTGITTTDEFQSFLSQLTSRCEYQIIAFTLAQVPVMEIVTFLEQFLHGVFFEIPGVLFYRASDKDLELAS